MVWKNLGYLKNIQMILWDICEKVMMMLLNIFFYESDWISNLRLLYALIEKRK